MHVPPPHVDPQEVLAAARCAWDAEGDGIEHLAVGFGAHHWRVCADAEPRLFLTLDAYGARHDAASLAAAYATAAALAADGLRFVHGGLDPLVLPHAGSGLSATPWLDGHRVGDGVLDADSAPVTAAMLASLHAASPPPSTPRWTPVVARDLPDRLAALLSTTWRSGPLAPAAQAALRDHLGDVEVGTARHDVLARAALGRPGPPWVVTHGEPHSRNQMWTDGGPVLVDWESVKLAPRERDLCDLVGQGWGDLAPTADGEMLELFDLEWRLDEVTQYATWFASPHTGTEDDREALAGLLEELGHLRAGRLPPC